MKVVTPFGEIPWIELSRFNDREMKALMIDVVNRTYMQMVCLFASNDALVDELLKALKKTDPVPEWNEPELPFPLGQ